MPLNEKQSNIKTYIFLFQTPCVDNKDFATLKFHAGPPYEVSCNPVLNKVEHFIFLGSYGV